MVTKNDIEQFQDRLDKELATVLRRLESGHESPSETDLLRLEARHLAAALQRITEGSYGLCAVCGVRMSVDSLHANPKQLVCDCCDAETAVSPSTHSLQ